MRPFCLTACDFMVYKGHKISLKLVSPIRRVNFRVRHLTCPPIYHRVTIHHDIYLKPVPSQFPHRIIHQFLSVHFFIDNLLLWRFFQAHHADEGIWAKNNLFVLCDGVFDNSSSSSFVFIQFWWGMFNFFASSNSKVLLIYD